MSDSMNDSLPKVYMDAFWRMFEKVFVREDGCWEFRGAKTSSGHGSVKVVVTYRFRKKRKTIGAHVLSFWAHKHRTRKHICHRCNFKPCVNPDHLYAGTRSQNMKQMFDDGLGKNQFTSEYQPARPKTDDCPF